VVNFKPQPFYLQETTLVPIEQDAGWAPYLIWRVLEKRKFLASPGFEPQTVQPVGSCYTNTILASGWKAIKRNF
jgi:hypothetical protein